MSNAGIAHHHTNNRPHLSDTWMRNAACRGSEEDFHADNLPDTRAALEVCKRCPETTKQACLEYALERYEEGVWGQTTTNRRKVIRRERRKAS